MSNAQGGMVPLERGFGVLAQENFLIKDVCRSGSYEFCGHCGEIENID